MINSISAQIVRVVLSWGSEVEDSSSIYTTEEVIGCMIHLFFFFFSFFFKKTLKFTLKV